jgi:hypothetical protein
MIGNYKGNESLNPDCCCNINRLSHIVVIRNPNNILALVIVEVLAIRVRDARRGEESDKDKS